MFLFLMSDFQWRMSSLSGNDQQPFMGRDFSFYHLKEEKEKGKNAGKAVIAKWKYNTNIEPYHLRTVHAFCTANFLFFLSLRVSQQAYHP